MSAEGRETIRLDKWLWQARFFKTRTLASGLVSRGRVRVNSQPVSKPARAVGAGDVLTFPQGDAVRVVRILACGDRRGPAPEAQALYEDMSEPVTRHVDPATTGPNPKYEGKGRPSARERRQSDGPDWS